MLEPFTLRCERSLVDTLQQIKPLDLALALAHTLKAERGAALRLSVDATARPSRFTLDLDFLAPFERNAWIALAATDQERLLKHVLVKMRGKVLTTETLPTGVSATCSVECEDDLHAWVKRVPADALALAIMHAIDENRARPLPSVPGNGRTPSRKRVDVPQLPLRPDALAWWEANRPLRGRVLKRALETIRDDVSAQAELPTVIQNLPTRVDALPAAPVAVAAQPATGIDPLRAEVGRQEQVIRDNEEIIEALEQDKAELERQIQHLTEQRDTLVSRSSVPQRPAMPLPTSTNEAQALLAARTTIQDAGRPANPDELLAVHLGLLHAPFTVLTGPPGTGKTSILQLYGDAIGMDVHLIAMSPAWEHQDDLMGHMRPLGTEPEFVAGPLGSLLIEHALAHPDPLECTPSPDVRSTLVILDEINLVVVEHVLAGMLSALALDRPEHRRLLLARASDTRHLADGRLQALLPAMPLGPGMVVAGTANEDHTTEGFSDRFRDRSAMLSLIPPELDALLEAQLSPRGPQQHRDMPAGPFLDTTTRAAWAATVPRLEEGPHTALVQRLKTLAKAMHDRAIGLPPGARSLRRAAVISQRALALLADMEVLGGSNKSRKNLENDLLARACDIGVGVTLAQRAVAITALQPDPEEAREKLADAFRKGGQLPVGGLCLRQLPPRP